MPYPSPNPALNFCRTLLSILVPPLVVLASGFATGVQAQTENYSALVIVNVPLSQSGFIFDPSGNLYATAERGGNFNCGFGVGCGTVFKLSRKSGGGWTKTTRFIEREGPSKEWITSSVQPDAFGDSLKTVPVTLLRESFPSAPSTSRSSPL